MTNGTISTLHAEALHASVSATLHTACALSASGRQVDLAGLDNMIGVLCAQIVDLSIEDARRFRQPLLAIGDQLDQLQQSLTKPGWTRTAPPNRSPT